MSAGAWLALALYLILAVLTFRGLWRSWSRQFGPEWDGFFWALIPSLILPVGLIVWANTAASERERSGRQSRFLVWLDRVTGVTS